MKVAVVEIARPMGALASTLAGPPRPSLHASEMFAEPHDLPALGVMVGKPKLDLAVMMKHKTDTVAANVNGVAFLLKKNKVDAFFGRGRVLSAGRSR